MQRDPRLRQAPPLLAALWAVAVAGAALAAPPSPTPFAPPAWPAGTGGAESNVASDPVRPLNLGKLRVMLEATELATVRNAVGTGTIVHQGNGSDALSFLCYTVADAVPPQRLWLSSSELAGSGRIDGIEAVELSAGESATPACPALPASFQPLRFDDGLWLGALAGEQKHAYGAAVQRGGPWNASFRGRHGSVDIVGSLAVDWHKGRAVGLYVAHASQN